MCMSILHCFGRFCLILHVLLNFCPLWPSLGEASVVCEGVDHMLQESFVQECHSLGNVEMH